MSPKAYDPMNFARRMIMARICLEMVTGPASKHGLDLPDHTIRAETTLVPTMPLAAFIMPVMIFRLSTILFSSCVNHVRPRHFFSSF